MLSVMLLEEFLSLEMMNLMPFYPDDIICELQVAIRMFHIMSVVVVGFVSCLE